MAAPCERQLFETEHGPATATRQTLIYFEKVGGVYNLSRDSVQAERRGVEWISLDSA
jgi:hypothetical protein